MSDDENEGQIIRDFPWIFETIWDLNKRYRKKRKDQQLATFFIGRGVDRAIDMFHRLDKDRGGSLTLKEFVFGLYGMNGIPKDITLNDLWAFVKAFDKDGSGTIDSSEWTQLVKEMKIPRSKKQGLFLCPVPETILFNDGAPSLWFFSRQEDGHLMSRQLPEKVWAAMESCLHASWEKLPESLKFGKRREVVNFGLLWIREGSDVSFLPLSHAEFTALAKEQQSGLKHVVAVQAIASRMEPGVVYKCVFSRETKSGNYSAEVTQEFHVPAFDKLAKKEEGKGRYKLKSER
ncbi:hypothetical protein GUITHDRAFT_116659 [Guillardia theta CCMP2712]|uniref:EF-hand domain-containing protein n=1 Tax=Guillardia theta (strain CCMP2712) TaxID=905079 RepID=L1IN69_GUITC|nr:hypothetical protein GUITHDRAFT_116659 [Guillardia theta CCMP2712]EKX37245.1 hypothetical protein GUITHDRAFT_116659 [Guillardia theta CCMP2712]|eukprot:XP_005824225.1 hypothetical protein GUITHDRAFT_116659 [Guillardia theta CCMP2712]